MVLRLLIGRPLKPVTKFIGHLHSSVLCQGIVPYHKRYFSDDGDTQVNYPLQRPTIGEIVSKMTKCSQKYGAIPLSTPVLELKETLAGKYGNDDELIYDLADQRGEKLSLRPDLTVPFARYLAMNKIQSFKRYQIDKVFRKNNHTKTEFYQFDFDIAGQYGSMIPDAECLGLAVDVLTSLNMGQIIIKVNHRKILDGIFAACEVPTDKQRAIYSALDKLDRMSWEEVRKEMVDEKGLDEKCANLIGEYVQLHGGKELLEILEKDARLIKQTSAMEGLKEMKILLEYCEIHGIPNLVRIQLDLSIARPFDYYTGIMFEAVMLGDQYALKPGTDKGAAAAGMVRNIAGGGRYDDLVGMFDSKGHKVSCVGVSFGVERILSILEQKHTSEVNPEEVMQVVTELEESEIQKPKIEFCQKEGKPLIKCPEIEEENIKVLEPKAKLDNDQINGNFVIKCPKGTRDFNALEMSIREEIFSKIKKCFEKHNAISIDTPLLELKEILTGKYGEDSKLIYDLADLGGEQLSLRYDLTVPFARYLAKNKIQKIKGFQIGKVYRRDKHSVIKGRFREFYQCDFDIAGQYDSMLPDIDCVVLAADVLTSLDLGKIIIKVNHRKVLDGVFAACGVPADKIRAISSAIDKLDKTPWEDVRKEMVDEKGLDEKCADLIREYVQLHGGKQLIEILEKDDKLSKQTSAMEGLKDMKILLKCCESQGILDLVQFDLSLARGLDYYTGVIYEAVLQDKQHFVKKPVANGTDEESVETSGVGSVAGGGRYDDLVGMFDTEGRKVPCVGISFGIERIFAILEEKYSNEVNPRRVNKVDVYVASAQKNLVEKRIDLCTILRNADINSEYSYKRNPKLLDQLQYCEENRIPLAVIIGTSELEKGMVKLRRVTTREERDVPMDQLVREIKISIEKSNC